ncbi:MAG: hypothetical protein CMLOHMNK_03643 [Steroidobacteraceae bacterium]|nr:hypothetical protein [Steroidobacteraceae bacterium]
MRFVDDHGVEAIARAVERVRRGVQRDELPGLGGPVGGGRAVLHVDARLRHELGRELAHREGVADPARAQRRGQRLREAQEHGLATPFAKPPPHLAGEQRLARTRAARDEAPLVSPQHVEHAELLAVERHQLLFAEASVLAECEPGRPGLTPQIVQRRDPPVVPRPRPIAEEPVPHRLERFAQIRQVLLPEDGAVEVTLSRRIAERASRERRGDGERGRRREPALGELLDEQARERMALLAGRATHGLAVLKPLAVAHIDGAALHLDHQHAAFGDGDHEVALALPTRLGPDTQRVPRGPTGGEPAAERAVHGLLARAGGRARRAAGEEAGGGHRG